MSIFPVLRLSARKLLVELLAVPIRKYGVLATSAMPELRSITAPAVIRNWVVPQFSRHPELLAELEKSTWEAVTALNVAITAWVMLASLVVSCPENAARSDV